MTAYVKNAGNTGTILGSQVKLIADGVVKSTSSISGLNAGDSLLVTFSWTVARGAHDLVIEIDPSNTILESNETNNSATRYFEPALPDLQITGVSWVPRNPIDGQSVTFYAQIENKGTGGDITDYLVRFSMDGTSLGTRFVTKDIGLGARKEIFANSGFEQNSWFNWTTSGPYSKTTLAKRSGSTADSLYAELTQTAYSSSSAYLTSTAFTVSDAILTFDAYTNNATNGTVEITNNVGTVVKGVTLNAGDWAPYVVDIRELIGQTVKLRAKTSHNTTVRLDNLRMGRNSSAVYVTEVPSWSWTASVGSHSITAKVDTANTIMESNEDNNDFSFVMNNIEIKSPNGGEKLYAEEVHTITWMSGIVSSNVRIEFSSDSGSNWVSIAENTPNDGSFDWNVNEGESDRCLIRIIDTLSASVRTDVSDSFFSIEDPTRPPAIVSHPMDQTVSEGESTTFMVEATGPNLHYQWRKNGIAITGATSSTYTTPAAIPSDNGAQFMCIVSSPYSSTESIAARLTVVVIPEVISCLLALMKQTRYSLIQQTAGTGPFLGLETIP